MNFTTQAVKAEDLVGFAADKLSIWSDIVGVAVTHADYGSGNIVSVEQRPGYIPLVTITFQNQTVTYNSDSFRNGKTSLLIDAALASQVKSWALSRTEIENQRIVIEERKLAKKQAAQRARVEILERFQLLTDKYNVPSVKLLDDEAISPLGAILEKLENTEQPDAFDLDWLDRQELHRLIAIIHYRDYKNRGDVWMLVKACSSLRRANFPDKALSISDAIVSLDVSDKKAFSALWTTRGGAFRDINDLTNAKKSASSAIFQSPTSFHPHNLLGAILYEEGHPEEGDKHFEEAVRLGSNPRDKDFEIRRSIDRSTGNARQRVVDYLLSKDPVKYAWVQKFQSGS